MRISRPRSVDPITWYLSRTVEGPMQPGIGPCLDSLLCSDKNGYPKASKNGRSIPAGRLILAWKLGRDLQPGEMALHYCDRPPCIRPKHLHPGSCRQNAIEAVTRGLWPPQGGSQNPGSKLTEAKVREVRRRVAAGEKQKDVAADMQVSRATISMVVNNKLWRDILAA